jgi:putative transposase
MWLKPKHLMRLFTHDQLHAHTSDACVQAFFASLTSWRERHKTDPNAHPPRRRKWYFRVEYKRTAMQLRDGTLRLSNGSGNDPLLLAWPWTLPQTVVIHWTGEQYEAIATYKRYGPDRPATAVPDEQQRRALPTVGIDLGEIHPAVSHGRAPHEQNLPRLWASTEKPTKGARIPLYEPEMRLDGTP